MRNAASNSGISTTEAEPSCGRITAIRWSSGGWCGSMGSSWPGRVRQRWWIRYPLRRCARRSCRPSDDIAGADRSLGCFRIRPDLPLVPNERVYWPEPIPPAPSSLDQALDLLERSIEQGAIIAAIGACTNLALLERRAPGILRRARLYLMGGYVFPPREGFPPWGHDLAWN